MPKDTMKLDAPALKARFCKIRKRSVDWADGLSAEDLCVQSMEDASPGKWHLAHVSWFWETFLLKPSKSDYHVFDERFCYLFNSYYNAVGSRHARPERGMVTRPDVAQVLAYRAHVDQAVCDWLDNANVDEIDQQRNILMVGFAHEEQHQELFLTDIKHLFSKTAFSEPVYASGRLGDVVPLQPVAPAPEWVSFEGGLETFGHAHAGFAFDNEGPEHQAYLAAFALATKPVTNAEYLAFIEAGGYQNAELWLSDGWARLAEQSRGAPFYWRKGEQGWSELTLHGLEALDPDAPVSHIDYFEASAFAEWAGCRLPEEREWELAARAYTPDNARWAEPKTRLHPQPVTGEGPLLGLFGEVWEWTRSAYNAYPGFKPASGAIGEYNGKFMCDQFVLRGGSCLSPPNHVRATYRNFFPANAQWQMTGFRLARDL